MRIFYAADNTPNSLIPSSRLWYNNLYLPLVDLGHEVIEFDYDLSTHFRYLDITVQSIKAFVKENRPKLEQALIEQIRREHRKKPIDLFFSYFYSACASPEIIEEIKSMGIVTMNWYCNASYQFHLIEDIAPAYNYCLVPEKFRLKDYRRIGANPIYCQEAANPNIYKPYEVPFEYDVTFVGQKYGDRAGYIRHLLDEGIDTRVWGQGWIQPAFDGSIIKKVFNKNRLRELTTLEGLQTLPRKIHSKVCKRLDNTTVPSECCGPSLEDDEYIRMYSRSRVNLGFSACGETHRSGQRILQIRLRDFEGPMCGSFYMVEYLEELEEFYEIGKEIICYYNKEDLADKVKFYLMHDAERDKIRKAGWRRAVSEHTWQKRFQTVFRKVGLDKR